MQSQKLLHSDIPNIGQVLAIIYLPIVCLSVVDECLALVSLAEEIIDDGRGCYLTRYVVDELLCGGLMGRHVLRSVLRCDSMCFKLGRMQVKCF